MHRIAALLTLITAGLLIHCGGSDDAGGSTPSSTDGGVSADGSTATNQDDSGTTILDGGRIDGASSSEPDHEGAVSIVENNTESEGAQFYDVPARSRCTIRTSGLCIVSVCPLVDPGDPSAVSTPVNGGNVTVSGGTSAPVVLTPTQGAVQVTSPWQAGDTLSFSSAGSTAVPAFTASLVYPSLITVTAPAPSMPEYTVPIVRASGMTFAWTAATPTFGGIGVTIKNQQPTQNVVVECVFDQKAGTGVISPDALGDLVAEGPHDTAISVSPTTQTVQNAGNFRVTTSILRFNPNYAVYGIVQ